MCHLQQLYAKYGDKGLVVLGFDASDDKQIALEMLRDNKATFPNIIDSSPAAMKVCFSDYQGAYGSAVPMSYVIDRDGKIVDGWYGYDEDEPKAIAAFQKVGGKLAESIRNEMQAEAAKSADTVNADAFKALQAGAKLAEQARQKAQAKTTKAVKTATTVKTANAVKSADAVAAAARQLFQAIRAVDYDRDWTSHDDWKRFPAQDVSYSVDRDYAGWVQWVCKKFKATPITDMQLGKVVQGGDGVPSVHFQLQLKGGEIIEGDLPFRWDADKKQWIARHGLDWHLQQKP
jgi:hypothetical protein